MTNAIVGFPTHTELTTPGSWTGSWQAEWPITNVNSLPLGRVARSTNAAPASTKFEILLPESQPVGLVTLINHNATNNGTVSLEVYGDAAGTVLLETVAPTLFWPAVYKTRNLKWEDRRWWSGQYNETEKTGNVPILPIRLARNRAARLIRVSVSDATNPADCFQLGYCDVATATEWSINFKYGAQYGFRDRTSVVEAEGGGKTFNVRGDVKIFQGEIDYLPHEEARAIAYELRRQMGTHKPFVWLPWPDRPQTYLTEAFLARNAALDPISLAFFERDTVPLNFEEVR